MNKQLFKILLLITCVYNSSYAMKKDEEDQSIEKVVHFRCQLRFRSEYIPADEDLEADVEAEQFKERIYYIAQNALLELQELISRHLNLFYFLPEEQFALKLNLFTIAQESTKRLPIIWQHKLTIGINKQIAADVKKEVLKFANKVNNIIISIKEQLKEVDYLIATTFRAASPVTMQIKMYIKQPAPEPLSYLDVFIDAVAQIFNFDYIDHQCNQ